MFFNHDDSNTSFALFFLASSSALACSCSKEARSFLIGVGRGSVQLLSAFATKQGTLSLCLFLLK